MKKSIFVISLLLISYCLSPIVVEAATPSPAPTSTLSEQVSELKERIASRVAQLKLVERRGIIGTVKDIANTEITIVDVNKKERFVDVDELTKFSSPSAKESFGLSDITKGTTLGFLGLYNKQSQRMLARFVDVLVLPRIIHGAVLAIDEENFAVTVVTPEKEQLTADIETTTKTLAYNKETDELERSGFSKITVGGRITVVGYPSKTEINRISAIRIIRLPDIPKNPMIKTIEQKTSTSSATPESSKQ